MKSFFLTRFLRCQILPRKLICRSVTSGPSPPYLEFSSQCDDSTRQKLIKDFQVHVDFISEAEESRLMEELTPKLKRMRYQYDHWDDAIHGYRETEKPFWNEENTTILDRLRNFVFTPGSSILKHVHVLDLAEGGRIKPHVDSVKFCGDTITGICLLSDAVMRLVHTEKPELSASALLPRRCLYVMRNYTRYDFNHEVLGDDESFFRGNRIIKRRRVSVICRSEPPSQDV